MKHLFNTKEMEISIRSDLSPEAAPFGPIRRGMIIETPVEMVISPTEPMTPKNNFKPILIDSRPTSPYARPVISPYDGYRMKREWVTGESIDVRTFSFVGKHTIVSEWADNKKDGMTTIHDLDGNIVFEMMMYKNKIQGEVRGYYIFDGRRVKRFIGVYSDEGKKHGKFIEYTPGGVPIRFASFSNGIPYGPCCVMGTEVRTYFYYLPLASLAIVVNTEKMLYDVARKIEHRGDPLKISRGYILPRLGHIKKQDKQDMSPIDIMKYLHFDVFDGTRFEP